MFNDFIREIREQLEAIRLAVTRPPRVRTLKAKPLRKTAYGWFKHSWLDAKFLAMFLESIPSIDNILDDPVEVYRGLDKDEKALVRELFEAQRAQGQRYDGASDA